jgi:enterochelin esterase-like enzyme
MMREPKRSILMALLMAGATMTSARSPATPASMQWVTTAIRAPRLEFRTFTSNAAQSKVSYHIYTPELFDTEKERRFPVLYWLHGSGGGLSGLPQLVKYFDDAIRAGKIPPMLVVFVNGLTNGMYCDWKDGSAPLETVIIRELLPHIDATFRTIASREGRLIEGFSMGGYGAARLGFKHHDLFSAVSILAGGPLQPDFKETPRVGPREREQIFQKVYGGDDGYFKAQSPWRLAEQNAAALRATTRIRQVIGDRDETSAFNRDFDAHLTRLHIPHTFTVLPGVGHKPMAMLNTLGKANWEFYRAVFGGEPKPAPAGK